MGARLFVENLPTEMSEEGLQALFGRDGRQVLSVSIMADRRTGQSHGYGFVEMASPTDAQQAIEALHGFTVRGQSLHVSPARPSVRR